MELRGRTVLINGIARIGAEVARALARRGARVAVSYRSSAEVAEEVVAEIERGGGEAAAFRGDLSNAEEAALAVERTVERFGGLDILINMASLYSKTPLAGLDAAAWERAMAVDARGSYLTSIAAAPHMKRAGEGRIVNFTDWLAASRRPRYLDYVPYYSSKMAVLGLTEALALELAPEVLVNSIAPGPILAPPDLGEDETRAVADATPVGKWGGPGEIVKAVLFLIDSDFVTGECIRVDGGRHLK